MEGGQIACTEIACPACDADAEWWRNYLGRSVEECALIDFACLEWTTAFDNECGCGCEQSADCPEYFNCMPPSPCDEDAIKTKCPYSGIAY